MKRSLLVSLMLTLVFTLMLVSIPVSFGQEARSYEAPEYPVPEKFNEAPMLAELVKEGKLPPVEERLPEEPFVVGPGVLVHEDDLPDWEVGKYGGVLRSVCLDPTLDWNLRDACMENFLCTPAHYTKPLMGNVAAEFSVSPDNKIFTFRLRKGLKWSDGQPVTTEDVRFAYEDVLLNEEITPIFPADYRSAGDPAGTPMKIEILDEYTFRVEFDEPYGRFLRVLGLGSLWGGYDVLLKPSHYLKQFHIKYTPVEEMRPYLKELGYSDEEWWRLFLHKDISWGAVCERRAIGFPTLGPWVRADSPTNIMAFDRNPYYYKVDTAGNQLPYVDRYESIIATDAANLPMTILSGEVNLNRDMVDWDKVSLYRENEQKIGAKIDLNLWTHNAPIALFINYGNPDPVWREVTNDVRFRRAVSYSIDRNQMADILYLGIAKPSRWFDPEYSPEKANELLDEMGLDKRDAQGWRIGPDGKAFEFPIVYCVQGGYWERAVELLVEYLQKVGIKATMKQVTMSLLGEMHNANQIQATIDWLDDVSWPYLHYDFRPLMRTGWGSPLWNLWYSTGGKEGEKPPEWIEEIYDLAKEQAAVNPATETAELWEEKFTERIRELIPMFPLIGQAVNPMIVPPNLGNWAKSGKASAAQFAAEHLFFK